MLPSVRIQIGHKSGNLFILFIFINYLYVNFVMIIEPTLGQIGHKKSGLETYLAFGQG